MPTPWDWLRGLIDSQQYHDATIPDIPVDPAFSQDYSVADMNFTQIQQSNQSILTSDLPFLQAMGDTMENIFRVKTAGKPASRVAIKGQNGRPIQTTRRTAAMIKYAEHEAGFTLVPTTGGYDLSPNDPSGSVDDKDHVDFTVLYPKLTPTQVTKAVKALRNAGFAAWYRPPNWDGQGGGAHIHAVPIGGVLSSSAQSQVRDYDAGLNGLRNRAKDNIAYRPAHKVLFDFLTGAPRNR